MGEFYDVTPGAQLSIATSSSDRLGDCPVRLDGTPHAEQAISSLRSMAADQVTIALEALGEKWAKVDDRLLHLLEDWQVREMREMADEVFQALKFLEKIAPLVDDEGDDDEPEPEPVPDPEGSATA
jgi:hypothetical protein